MTTPAGDLPDWQTLVSPAIQVASIIDQSGGLTVPLRQSSIPFRVWGLWVSHRFTSNNVYAAGTLGTVISTIQDGNGNVLLGIDGAVRAANQIDSEAVSIAVNGFTPLLAAGFWTINLVSGSSPANTDYHISGGIYYSVP